jgi:CRP-like cAMP-binding protein/Zn-dependent protease
VTLHDPSTSHASPEAAPVHLDAAVELLRGTALFDGVDAEALMPVAARGVWLSFGAGGRLTAQGESADTVLVVASGSAEVTQLGRAGPVALATVEPGSVVGEVAALVRDGRRSATVIALEPLTALALQGADIRNLARDVPEIGARLAQRVEALLRFDVLAHNVLTAGLPFDEQRRLAETVERRDVAAGTVLMRQGDAGDVCYCIAAGRAEVVRRGAGGKERRLDTVGPGSVVGEAALATRTPRTATVRMLEDGSVLVVRRDALLAAIDSSTRVQEQLLHLLRVRARPRRCAGVTLHERTNADGEVITILKDEQRGAYFTVSPAGRLVWDHLDGEHNLNQLTLAHFRRFGQFAPELVSAIVLGLVQAAFARTDPLADDVPVRQATMPRFARALQAALRAVTWEKGLSGVDPWLSALHRRGARMLFTVPGLVLLATVAFAGAVALLAGPSLQPLANGEIAPGVLIALLPAHALSVAVHELAHALTVKHFGRHVYRVGVGWHFIGPVGYVDTSDMWLAGKGQRLCVTLAGPISNLVLAGLAALGAVGVEDSTGSVLLWLLAIANYALAFANLNPLLEFDGYYLLTDLLERPNLRAQSLAWLGSALRRRPQDASPLRSHRLELAYGLGSLIYVVAVAALAIIVYRALLGDILARATSPDVATFLSWGAAILAVAVLLAALAAQLDGERHAAPRSAA